MTFFPSILKQRAIVVSGCCPAVKQTSNGVGNPTRFTDCCTTSMMPRGVGSASSLRTPPTNFFSDSDALVATNHVGFNPAGSTAEMTSLLRHQLFTARHVLLCSSVPAPRLSPPVGADRADLRRLSPALGCCYSSVRRARDFWDRCDAEVGDTDGWRQALSSVASLRPSSSYSRGQASASG